MDFLSLVFRADTTQLDQANKKLGDLGNKVDDAAKKAETSGRRIKSSFDSVQASAQQTEKVVGGFNKVFETLGGAGGILGDAAARAQQVFNAFAGLATSQRAARTEAQASASAFSAQNGILVANAASMLNAKKGLDGLTEATKRYNSIQAAWAQNKSDFPGRAPAGSALAAQRRDFNEQSKSAYKDILAATDQGATSAVSASVGWGRLALVLGGVASVASVAAVALGVVGRGAREAADAQDELAQKMGVSRESLVAYQMIANENGTSVEALVRTYDKLSKSMNKMDEDNAKTEYAFASLGMSLEDIKDQKPEQVAANIIANYEKLGGTAKATAAIIQLLGPAWRENSVAIKAMASDTDDVTKRVRDFGGVAADVLVKQGNEQEKSLTNLKNAWQELKNQIAIATSTMTTDITNWMATSIASIAKVLEAAGNKAKSSDLYGGIPESTRRAIMSKVSDEQSAGTIAKGKDAYKARVKELYDQELQLIRRTDELIEGRDNGELRRLQNISAAHQKAEADRLKAASAAAKSPEQLRAAAEAAKKAAEDAKKAAKEELDAYLKRFKLQMDAEEEFAKSVQETNDIIKKDDERKLQVARDLIAYQEDLVRTAKEWSDQLSKAASYPMLRRETKSPVEQARLQTDEDQKRIRSQFGGTIAGLRSKEQEAADAGDFAASEQYRKQALATEQQMNETLRESEWVYKNVKASSEDMWAGAKAGAKAYFDQLGTVNTAMADFAQNTLQDFSDRLANLFINGKFGFKDFVKTAIAELIKLEAKLLMMKMYSGYTAFFAADGAAFNNGVQMFASGGVVDRPTAFGMSGGRTGVMGEAGPEGILPLSRINGKLGVNAEGLGGTTIGSINITVQGATTNEGTGQAVAEALITRLADARIYNATRSGGIIAKAYGR